MAVQLIICGVLTILFDLIFEVFLIGGLYYIITKGELYINRHRKFDFVFCNAFAEIENALYIKSELLSLFKNEG